MLSAAVLAVDETFLSLCAEGWTAGSGFGATSTLASDRRFLGGASGSTGKEAVGLGRLRLLDLDGDSGGLEMTRTGRRVSVPFFSSSASWMSCILNARPVSLTAGGGGGGVELRGKCACVAGHGISTSSSSYASYMMSTVIGE